MKRTRLGVSGQRYWGNYFGFVVRFDHNFLGRAAPYDRLVYNNVGYYSLPAQTNLVVNSVEQLFPGDDLSKRGLPLHHIL